MDNRAQVFRVDAMSHGDIDDCLAKAQVEYWAQLFRVDAMSHGNIDDCLT